MNSGTSSLTAQPKGSDIYVIPMATTIKIMVQDRHNLFVQGFCYILRDWGFQVTGETRDHIGLMEAITNQGLPDIALIEYKTETNESLIMAKEIKGAYPAMKLMLLIDPTPNDLIPIEKMKMVGIDGVIDKRHHSLLQAKQGFLTVYAGGTFFEQSQRLI